MGLFDLFTGKKKDRIGYDVFALILYNNWYQSTREDELSFMPNPTWFKDNEYIREWYNSLTEAEKRAFEGSCFCLAIFITLAACQIFLANDDKNKKARVHFMNLLRDEFVRLGNTSQYQFLTNILNRNTPQYQKLVEALLTENKLLDSVHRVLFKDICLDCGLPNEKVDAIVNLFIYGKSMLNFSWNMKYLGKSSEQFEIIE